MSHQYLNGKSRCSTSGGQIAQKGDSSALTPMADTRLGPYTFFNHSGLIVAQNLASCLGGHDDHRQGQWELSRGSMKSDFSVPLLSGLVLRAPRRAPHVHPIGNTTHQPAGVSRMSTGTDYDEAHLIRFREAYDLPVGTALYGDRLHRNALFFNAGSDAPQVLAS
jgi:hypothetical protein